MLVVMYLLDLEDLSVLLSIVAAGLWVVAAVILALIGPAKGRALTLLAVGAYGVAFVFPAAVASETTGVVMGFAAFTLGWQVVPLAWLANPLFIVALFLRRRGSGRRAAIAAAFAGVFALTTPLTLPDVSIRLALGYALWVVAPFILALTLVRSDPPRPEPTRPEPPPG